MKTKKIYLIAWLLLGLILTSRAQTLDRSVIGATGSNNDLLSYTVGETIIETANNNVLILTQGFQQPDKLWATLIDPLLGEASFTLFPNPTRDKLVLKIETEKTRKLSISITDVRGRRVVSNKKVETGQIAEHDFDISAIAVGNYVLLLNDEEGRLIKSFRFQKRY